MHLICCKCLFFIIKINFESIPQISTFDNLLFVIIIIHRSSIESYIHINIIILYINRYIKYKSKESYDSVVTSILANIDVVKVKVTSV